MEASSRSHAKPHLQPPAVENAGQDDVELLGESPSPIQSAIRSQAEPTGSKPTGKISVKNVMQLLECQDYRCALTGRRLTPEEASLDHIIPVRDGGPHLIENTQVLHRDVNRAKSILSNEDFIAMCREVVAHTG